MDLSIIILSFNTKDLVLNCINSIVEQYEPELKKDKFEIIVVDNASSDDSVTAIKKLKIANLEVIESKENLGFSNGCNLGAKNAKGDCILFLNSDTEIKDQGFIRMLEYLKMNENVGILGGALRNENGTLQNSCGNFYSVLNLLLVMLGFERLGLGRKSPKRIKKVDWVSGACLMIKRKAFEKIGGFETELFMYMEDMELCFRARKKGSLTYFYPEIILYHKERGSSNRGFAVVNIYKGILFFFKKYKPNWQYKIARYLLFGKSFILVNTGKLLKNKYLTETYGKTLELF